jgi:hypothetical protein
MVVVMAFLYLLYDAPSWAGFGFGMIAFYSAISNEK